MGLGKILPQTIPRPMVCTITLQSTIPMAIPIPPGYVHEIHSRTTIPLTDEDHDTHPHNPCLPKFNFPVYDGETTKLWIT